jgi:ABC-2 type transport system permease protein
LITAILRVMILGLVRDRGALVLAFLLPPAIFIIFAAIFAGTTGGEVRLRAGLAAESDADSVRRLAAALRSEPNVDLTVFDSATMLREHVQRGAVDVGVILRGDLAALGGGPAPIVVIADAMHAMAADIVGGHLQRIVIGQLAGTMPALVERETLAGRGRASGAVTYYAGAVSILFLLVSAMQSAATFIDERESGIMDRLLLGPGGTTVLLNGKFLFLVGQGLLQVSIIFLVGWLAYGIALPASIGAWAVTSLAAAAAAAGIGLALAALCTTRQQAQTLASFLVLIVSALGGSMVPRFLMPSWLQALSWWTPNAWVIEAYYGALWRGEAIAALVPAWAILAGMAGVGLAIAHVAARRAGRI